jgi:hypothetical protein
MSLVLAMTETGVIDAQRAGPYVAVQRSIMGCRNLSADLRKELKMELHFVWKA